MKMRFYFFLPFVFLLFVGNAFTNNIMISNVALTGGERSQNYTYVKFDLYWDNSWRTSTGPNNWDAAWVFVKYDDGNGIWRHAYLSTDAGTHSVTVDNGDPARFSVGNSTINSTQKAMGLMIYRANDGTGFIDWQDVRIRWNYGENGVAGETSVNIKVFAIEMVYVPQDSFSLGSGGAERDHFYSYPNPTTPYVVDSEDSISVGMSTGDLFYDHSIPTSGDQGGPIPKEFPKGYRGFYCMKYEITQKQYVDFLNLLKRPQQNTRTQTDLSNIFTFNHHCIMSDTKEPANRNGIRCDLTQHPLTDPVFFYCDLDNDDIGDEPEDGHNIACNFLNWTDGCAYADWAGLRPLTELEYEKACRGNQPPVANEFAWGVFQFHRTSYAPLIYDGTARELPNNPTNYNCAIDTTTKTYIGGPLRVGIFATYNSTRTIAGATYYGIMEMSGNLEEYFVSVGDSLGRIFTGLHGDGALDSLGNANVDFWPSPDVLPSANSAIGAGIRGGDWNEKYFYACVSDRSFAAQPWNLRNKSIGMRYGITMNEE